ncbi:hypothetical protein [Parasphingorhabdus sp. NYA22]
MTFQDEFIHRLRVVRGEATGDGVSGSEPQEGRSDERNHPNPSFEKEGLESEGDGGEDTRHPEFISGPLEAEPEDWGVGDGVLSRQAIEDKRVQDDEDVRLPGGEHTPDKSVRLERSRETGDGGDVSRLRSTRTDGSDGDDANTPSPTTRHDGWHRELRVKFLEALAQTGNVQASAYFVQRTRQSAYDLKRRDPDFARAWLAALVLAREEAQDKLQERAIEGVEEEVFYHGEVVATRRRYDSRLLLAHLARLDKIAAQIPAQRGAARFGDMLDAIGKGEDTAPLIATPTEEELAIRAAEAEARGRPVPEEEEEGEEFYAVSFPYQDGPPDYYRMTPEEAAEMQREVPGLTTTPTGTRDEAVINALPCHADAMHAFRRDEGEKGKNL